ncbi:MAG: phosphoribosyl-ATP pyrophosphohydrolase, nonfunctional, partial [candidate division CPR3 bacterium GW2011_GWE2_35_7]
MKKIFQIFYILILSLTLLLNPKILIHATDNSGYFPEFQDWGDPVGNGVFGAQQGNETGVGDLNGDGYTDLVIGEHVYQSSMGKVFLYKGSNNGLLEGGSIVGEKANDYFGYVVTIGDLNNDEIDDLVIDAVYAPSSGTGRLYVFFGKSDFFETITSYSDADIIIDAEQAGSRFGGTDQNAIGDFNNDGWPDLATGAYRYNPGVKANAGKTYIFFGGEHAWDSNLNAGTDADFTVTGDVANYYVGDAHVAGDVNNDGIDDLVILNWRGDLSYCGDVAIFYGSDSFSGNKLPSEADLIVSGDDPNIINENFGRNQNVLIADIDGDNLNDLIVGATGYRLSGETIYRGATFIFLGSSTYQDQGTVIDYSNATITLFHSIELDTTSYGYDLAAFDYNNDGKTDLVVSAPFLGDGTDYYGGVYLYTSETIKGLSGTVVADDYEDLLIK